MNIQIPFDKIKLWIIDVDGTLTDSGIYYDSYGNELKKFSTKDAAGFFSLHALGLETMILTGRECNATLRRLQELNVTYIFQGIKNKKQFLVDFLREKKPEISFDNIACIGDDLNDLDIMQMCGLKACPADSCTEIKSIADYISSINGGHGAVRDIIESYLRQNGQWNNTINKIYGGGI